MVPNENRASKHTHQVPAANAGQLWIEELTTIDGLKALRREWTALWERSSTATPFQAPEWILPWRQYFGQGQLFVLALRRAGRLMGLAPFQIDIDAGSMTRRVSLMGTGHSDYLDVLLDDEILHEGAAMIFKHLSLSGERWDACDFQQLRPGSPLLISQLTRGWSWETTPQEVCPVLSLFREAPAIPARMRSKLGYYRRRAERFGVLRTELATKEKLEESFTALLQVHRARWAKRNLPGVLWDEKVQRFHLKVSAGLLQRDALRLYTLRLNGQPIAAYYGFLCHRRAYYYLGGFDPDYEHLSAGTLLVGHAIEAALQDGAQEFDFLRGRESYKYHWGAQDRPSYRRRLRFRPIDSISQCLSRFAVNGFADHVKEP